MYELEDFMKTLSQTAMFAIIAVGFGFIGCHHAAKMPQPALPESKPSAPVETPKVATPAPPVEFKPVDMDSEARQALRTIYFDFDKYDLRPDAIASLAIVAKFLKDHPSIQVLAAGNCDQRGSEEYNMGLGWNRAKAVKNYLTSYGISADRIEITSYGKERLARTDCAMADDDACNQANRRVEWSVLGKIASSSRVIRPTRTDKVLEERPYAPLYPLQLRFVA
jgi:peptidoglycan-associated lipoprotein